MTLTTDRTSSTSTTVTVSASPSATAQAQPTDRADRQTCGGWDASGKLINEAADALSVIPEGTSILDFIRYAAAFLLTKQQYYEWRLDT